MVRRNVTSTGADATVTAAAGRNWERTPGGRPDAVRFTAPVKPLRGSTVKNTLRVVPGSSSSDAEETDRLSGTAGLFAAAQNTTPSSFQPLSASFRMLGRSMEKR